MGGGVGRASFALFRVDRTLKTGSVPGLGCLVTLFYEHPYCTDRDISIFVDIFDIFLQMYVLQVALDNTPQSERIGDGASVGQTN